MTPPRWRSSAWACVLRACASCSRSLALLLLALAPLAPRFGRLRLGGRRRRRATAPASSGASRASRGWRLLGGACRRSPRLEPASTSATSPDSGTWVSCWARDSSRARARAALRAACASRARRSAFRCARVFAIATPRSLAGLLVRGVAAAPAAVLAQLDPVRRVPPRLVGLVVAALALLASERHRDSDISASHWLVVFPSSVRAGGASRAVHRLLRKKTPPLALRRGGARWPKDSARALRAATPRRLRARASWR